MEGKFQYIRAEVEVSDVQAGFLAGASYASQDTEERLKQAHNEGIEKAIDLLGRRVGFGYLEENWDSVKAEIQKLKL